MSTCTNCRRRSVRNLPGSPTTRLATSAPAPPPLHPVENLWAFTQAGADLALFSGGKALRGPQATGLVLGRATLIEAIRANGAPHQRLARAMKVGKEEMLGLLAAVRRYLAI